MTLRNSLWLAGLAAALILPAAASAEQDLTKLPPAQNGYKPKTTAWGEPDLTGSWPIDSLNGRTPLQRDAKYGNRQLLNDAEFAERNAMVQQLEQRYQNENKENKMGIGHWAEVGAANRRTSWITSPADGRLPEYTDEGKRLSGGMHSTWRRNQDFDAFRNPAQGAAAARRTRAECAR